MTKNYNRSENHEGVRRGSRDLRGGQGAVAALVSVVIPCYNQAHFLGEAIESVMAQSHPRFEVIVVDDGSTDNTAKVAKRYPGVRCVRQNNQGLAAARNSGIRESKGSYIVFLDADDRLLPEALEAGLECFEAHPECAFVAGRCRRITSDGTPLTGWQQHRVEGDPYVELLRSCPIFVPAVMYRSSVFESFGGFNTSFRAAEDYDLYYRVAKDFPIYCHDTVVAEIRRHNANMTRNSTLMLESNLNALHSNRAYIHNNKRYKEAYKAGVKFWQDRYGVPSAWEVLTHVRERKWQRVVQGILVLVRYYPRGLILLLNKRRMERHRFARRLKARKQELKVHERRLKELESTQEPESTLVRRRQEVQQLRRGVQGLEQRIQALNQRGWIGRNSRIWKVLKRLGQIRAKVSTR